MYVTAEKTVHSVIVFYDEENKESAQYLLEKMDFRDNFIIKKYHTDFGESKVFIRLPKTCICNTYPLFLQTL